MNDPTDGGSDDDLPNGDVGDDLPDGEIDDVPVVTCERCDREWTVEYELTELRAGNGAIEQFAMDHRRHTGHYPDDVTPWLATCRRCPAGEAFLAERPARRWARTHTRHTRHAVDLEHGDGVEEVVREQDLA